MSVKSLIVLAASLVVAAPASGAASAKCQEDQPCWTWSTMGNAKRGVYVVGSDRVRVVGVTTFARLWRADRINWDVTVPLRGDFKALALTDCN